MITRHRPIRLTVVQTHPVQYYAPWFRHIAARCPELDLTVLYATAPTAAQQGVGFGVSFQWDTPLVEGYRCRILRAARPRESVHSERFWGLDVPAIGIMDAALCFESAGLIKYGNKGNMTKQEIDFTCDKLIELKKAGQFRATWTTFDQSVQLMAAGEVVIQSMWSPAVAAVRVKEIPCVYAPVNVKNGKEGYRGWCNGMGLMKHLSGKKLDAAYEYLNWYLSGWQGGFVGRYGYYSPVPSTAKKFLTAAEWDFWYDGKPAPSVINDPYGVPMEKAGTKRDGGSFLDRVKNISCWNTLMDEAAFMNKRWNDFKIA